MTFQKKGTMKQRVT